MLNLVQESHLGIIKCKQRALEVLYWPAMNSDIEETVKNCSKCPSAQRKQFSEALLPTETPKLPFVMVGTDQSSVGRKSLWKKVADKQLALLYSRTTLLEGINL